MKRIAFVIVLVLAIILLGSVQGVAQDDVKTMTAFRDNLIANLASPNDGVRESAVYLLMRYGDRLHIDNEEHCQAISKAFQKRLRDNLASDNPGLRFAAAQLVIHFGDQCTGWNKDIVFRLAHEYRSGSSFCCRQMALVALWRTDDSWGKSFIKTSLDFEEDPVLLRTIQAMVLEDQKKIGP